MSKKPAASRTHGSENSISLSPSAVGIRGTRQIASTTKLILAGAARSVDGHANLIVPLARVYHLGALVFFVLLLSPYFLDLGGRTLSSLFDWYGAAAATAAMAIRL
jgi:hypothetical protein